MHQILLHIKSMTNVDWFQKLKKNNHEDSIIMRIKFQRRIIFTFSEMIFLIMYSYKASLYLNAMKAQWQCSPTKPRRNCFIKFKIFFKNLINFISILFTVFNLNGQSKKFIKRIRTQYIFRMFTNMRNEN